MFKNWKTTLVGVLSFLVTAGPVLPSVGHLGSGDFTKLAVGTATLVLGMLSKDHDK